MTASPPGPLQPLQYDAAAYWYARDLAHLRTLSICCYVWGGLTCLVSSIFIIHIAIGMIMVTGGFPASGQPAPPQAMGWVFIAMGSVAVIFGWAAGILTIYSGVCLRARKHWVFSIVMAGISCFSVPLGTLLGVFTIIVLSRDSVKALYGRYTPPPYMPGGLPH